MQRCVEKTSGRLGGQAKRNSVKVRHFFVAGLVSIGSSGAIAQDAVPVEGCPNETALSCTIGDRVIYQPPFFEQYNPITALDMVRRVPGFSIDEGENVRGFGGAAGNILIDGQRPSTKSADINDVLSRISADNVARIELIRGGTGGLDVGGQSVVVNVILSEGGESSPWEFSLIKRRPGGGLRPAGEISYLGNIGKTKYTLGTNVFGISLVFESDEEITRFAGDDETRRGEGDFREQGSGVNLKLERPFDNGDTARFNFESGYTRLREASTETRFLAIGGPDLAFFDFPFEEFEYEIGADYEHDFTDQFGVKLIGLFGRENEKFESGFEFQPAAGEGVRSLFISDSLEGETIGRVEFDWSGWDGHTIQFGGEYAKNFIDSEAELLRATGADPFAPVAIDGANTRVTELRGEPFVNDSWR